MNCIRCGRKILEGKTFCDDCAGVVQEPLVETPYTSKHIILPARTEAVKPQKKLEKKPEKKPEKPRSKRLVRAVVALSLVCVLLVAACGYGVFYHFSTYQRERNRLRMQEEEMNRQALAAAQVEQELTEVQTRLSEAQSTISEQKQEIIRLEQEANTYQLQDSQSQQAVRELQEKYLSLVDEKTALVNDVTALTAQVDKLNSRLSSAEESNRVLLEKSAFFDAHVAFVENDGTDYYHNYSCPYFKKQSYWAYSINLAISRGYTACPYCGG